MLLCFNIVLPPPLQGWGGLHSWKDLNKQKAYIKHYHY